MLTVELVRKKAAVPFTKNSELDLEKLLTSLPELFSKNAFQPIGGDPLPGDSILLEQIKKSTQGPMFMEMRHDDFVNMVEKNVGKGAIPESGIRSVLESPFIEETIPTGQIANAKEMGKNKQSQNNSGPVGNVKDQPPVNTQQPAVSPPKASPGSGPGPAASPTIPVPLDENKSEPKPQENEWEKDPAEEQAIEEADGQIDPYSHQGLQGYPSEGGEWYDPHAAHGMHDPYGPYGMNGGYPPQHQQAYMQYGSNMHQGYYYPPGGHYPPQPGMGSMGHPNVVQGAAEVLPMGPGSSSLPAGRKPLKYVKDSVKGFPPSQSNAPAARQGTGSSPALPTGGLEGEESEEQGQESPSQHKGPVASDRVVPPSQEKSEASGQPQPANPAAPAEDEDSPIKMAAQANMIKSAPITEDIVGAPAEPAGEFEDWEAPMQHPGVPYPDSEYGYHQPYGYDYGVEGEEVGAHKYYPGGVHQYDPNYYDNYYYPPNREVYPYHYNQRRDQIPPPGHHHGQMMPPMDPYMHGGGMWGYGHGPEYDYMQPGAPHQPYGYGYDYQNPEHGNRRGMHEHMDMQQHPHPGQPGLMNGNPADKRGGKSSQGNNQPGQPKKQKDSQHHQGDGSNPGSSNKLPGGQAKHSDRGQQVGNGPNKKGGSNKPNQSSPNIPPGHPGQVGPQSGPAKRQEPTQQKPGSQEQQYSGQNLQQSAGQGNNRGLPQNGQNKKRAPLNHSNSGQNQGGGPPMPTSFSNLDNLQQPSNQQPQQARKNKKDGNPPSGPARQDSAEDQTQKQPLGRAGGGYDYNSQNQNQNQRKNQTQNQAQGYTGPQYNNGNQKPGNPKNAGQPNSSPQQYQNQGLQGNQGNGQKRFPNQNQNPYIGSPPQNQGYSNQNQDSGPQGRKQQGQKNHKQQSEEFDDDDEHWDSRDEGQTPSGKKSKQQVYFVKK